MNGRLYDEVLNAQITDADLGFNDHTGTFGVTLFVNYDKVTSQGYSSPRLDAPDKQATEFGMAWFVGMA